MAAATAAPKKKKSEKLAPKFTNRLDEIFGDELHEETLRPVVGSNLGYPVLGVAGHVTLDRVGHFVLVHAWKKMEGPDPESEGFMRYGNPSDTGTGLKTGGKRD